VCCVVLSFCADCWVDSRVKDCCPAPNENCYTKERSHYLVKSFVLSVTRLIATTAHCTLPRSLLSRNLPVHKCNDSELADQFWGQLKRSKVNVTRSHNARQEICRNLGMEGHTNLQNFLHMEHLECINLYTFWNRRLTLKLTWST